MSADTNLMPIPGAVDPVPVARVAKPRADGRIELVGLTKGQLHPRAVPLYNALHRFIGPVILAFVPGFLVGALAWGLHIAVDRAVGYGLRDRDGFQRA